MLIAFVFGFAWTLGVCSAVAAKAIAHAWRYRRRQKLILPKMRTLKRSGIKVVDWQPNRRRQPMPVIDVQSSEVRL